MSRSGRTCVGTNNARASCPAAAGAPLAAGGGFLTAVAGTAVLFLKGLGVSVSVLAF